MDEGPGDPDSEDMKRKHGPQISQELSDALAALGRDGEPVVLRNGRRPVAVLISIEDFRAHFAGATPPRITTAKNNGATYPEVERRRGERRKGDRRKGNRARPASNDGDPSATLDVLRELRSLGITPDPQ